MYTLFKFVCVGVLNTALDFVVFNLLLMTLGTGSHGELFVLCKTLSFFAAVANSYVLNKFWVFESPLSRGAREPTLFFIVSTLGFLVNVSVSFVAFSAVVGLVSTQIAANLGALAGTSAVFAWNFIGYRTFVFRKHKHYEY